MSGSQHIIKGSLGAELETPISVAGVSVATYILVVLYLKILFHLSKYSVRIVLVVYAQRYPLFHVPKCTQIRSTSKEPNLFALFGIGSISASVIFIKRNLKNVQAATPWCVYVITIYKSAYLRPLLVLHIHISTSTSSEQRNCASWASQPQKTVTLRPQPGGETTKSIRDM
jgi:hypothetical protein